MYFRHISANSLIAQCQTDLQHQSKHSIFSYSLSCHILVKTEGCTPILQISWSNRNIRKGSRSQRKDIASSRISGNPASLVGYFGYQAKLGIQKLCGLRINTTLVSCFSSLKYIIIPSVCSSTLKASFST